MRVQMVLKTDMVFCICIIICNWYICIFVFKLGSGHVSTDGATHMVHGEHVQTCDKAQLGPVTQPTPLELFQINLNFIITTIVAIVVTATITVVVAFVERSPFHSLALALAT